MASFDLDTFLASQGQGQGLIGSIGTSFGLPSCMLNLTQDLLSLIPGPALNGMLEATDAASQKANQVIASMFNKLGLNNILAFDTENGFISFASNSSELLANSGESGFLQTLTDITTAMGEVAAIGGQLYSNYQAVAGQYERIKDCLDSFLNVKKFSGGAAGDQRIQLNSDEYNELLEQRLGPYLNQLRAAKDALDALNKFAADLRAELAARNKIPELEPRVREDYSYLFSGSTGITVDEETPELIRLVFGPPKTTTGQYLLSTDGLYYDSQSEDGLQPVLLQISDTSERIRAAERWKFNFDPNAGGKGEQLSSRNFYEWVNSIFDETIVDDSLGLQDHYEKDHFLKVLEGQGEKRILDINGQITQLEASGAAESIIDNYKQSLLSEIAYHTDKVNRRKKQIEIAVKAPQIFGKGQSPAPGYVPINDFSYLQDCNISLALDRQKSLVIDQESVSGVVLPIEPKFVITKSSEFSENVGHLFVPQVGLGAIITDTRSTITSSGLELSISDVITSAGLISVYNFLNSNVVAPSSTEYTVLNCATVDDYNNAQLAALDSEFAFGNSNKSTFGLGYGLGSVYLEGITRNNGVNPSGLGSYVRLPDTSEYQDWLYKKSGASFDTWAYVPFLNTSGGWGEGLAASSLYRLVLACENTGAASGLSRRQDILNVPNSEGIDYTKGMIMGFTRDRRWVTGEEPTNDGSVQEASAGGFILAPTIAYDLSSVAFISKAKSSDDCNTTKTGWYGMFVPMSATTQSGFALSACADEFCHLVVSIDYETDEVTLYLDSEVLATSSVVDVFGSKKHSSVKIPSFKKINSFEYKETTVGSLAPASLKAGPKLNTYFTPWILGGGYTDGMALTGNFMGGQYNGVTSGLKGYLGSTKLYSKPLNNFEVKFNYSIQSKLYKRVEVSRTSTGTGSAPIA